MWVPKTEEDVIEAVSSGAVEESPTFDAKKEVSAKNLEIAKDIAAMTTDGGTIVYGIDEDDNGQPTVLSPITIGGQIERISSIARTSIQEPPDITLWGIRTKEDPSKGYIVLLVPPSARAPHMVIAGKGSGYYGRYYGREGKQNKILTEGEVARLYERRQKTEANLDILLDEVIGRLPLEQPEGLGFLHIFARPVFAEEGFLNRIIDEDQAVQDALTELVKQASKASVYPRGEYTPDFEVPGLWVPRVNGYRGFHSPYKNNLDFGRLDMELLTDFDHNGTIYLFCGRAAIMSPNDKDYVLLHKLIAGILLRFVTMAGSYYGKANYAGTVDMGVAVTGIQNVIPYNTMLRHFTYDYPHYDSNDYRRTRRVSALMLMENPLKVADELISPFITALFQRDYDPYSVMRVRSNAEM